MQGHTRPLHSSVLIKDVTSHFFYEMDFKQHEKVHTGKNKFLCPSRGCIRSYTTKGALKFHMQLHDNLTFICDTCGKSFPQKPYLQQRIQGAQLGGWRALCGQAFQWLKKMYKHEDTCKNCAVLELKKNKKLSDLRAKATVQGLEHKKKLVVKKEKKRK